MPGKTQAKLDERSIANLKASVREYHDVVARLKTIGNVKKAPLRGKKGRLSTMGRGERRMLLRDQNAAADRAIDQLINLSQLSYHQYRSLPGRERNTHEYITDQAIELLGMDSAAADILHIYCTYPDDPKSDMSDLIFEGHFYGKTGEGAFGNFLVDLLPGPALKMMEERKKVMYGDDEDIHEHAVLNFTRYCNQALQARSDDQNLLYLGVAAHFLQDLTAPHHTGNYPAVPYVGHVFFEKFTSQYVYRKPKFKISQAAYEDFKARLKSRPDQPELYALEVTGLATPYIRYIKSETRAGAAGGSRGMFNVDAIIDKLNDTLMSGKHEPWEKAIMGAVPLAVYATACLFETALSKKSPVSKGVGRRRRLIRRT